MRLRVETIELLAKRVVETLVGRGLITLTNVQSAIEEVRETILDELSLEDELDGEVVEILEAQINKLPARERGQIDVDEMFRLIKKQLAKDRKIIL